MAAAPRDMTTGELEVRLDSFESNVMAVLQEIRNNMVTEAVFEARWAAYEQRVTRIEKDLQEWIRESTEAHVSLDRDSKARHKETEAAMEAMKVKLESDIDKSKANTRTELRQLRTDFEESKKDTETVKRSRINIWLAAGVAILGSIFTKLFLPDWGQ